MKFISNIIKIILILIIVIFSALNTQTVQLHYMFWQDPFQMPLFIVIIFSFLLGGLVFWLFSLKKDLKRFMEIRSLRSELDKAKRELNSIKSAPLNKDLK